MLGSDNIIPFLPSDKDSGLGFLADSPLSASTKYVYIPQHIREMAAITAHARGNVLYLA